MTIIPDNSLVVQFGSSPLPILTASLYDFPLAFHVKDGVYYYAILDWVAGLTGEVDVKLVARMWDNFKNQTSFSKGTLKLPYVASDGKTYQRDFVMDETLYRFAAYARPMADRPTLAVIKDYLAKAGAFTDKVRLAGPAALPETRVKSIEVRKEWTNAFREALIIGLIEGWMYGKATNITYVTIFNKNAKEILEARGLRKGNARDLLTEQGLLIIMTAESTLDTKFSQYYDELTPSVAFQLTARVCEIFQGSVLAVQEVLGYDLATGLPLLE